MLKTRRSTAVTAAVAAALAAGGITYASAASGPVAQAPVTQKAEAPQAPFLGTGTGGDPGKGNEGTNNVGGFVGNGSGGNGFGGNEGRRNEGRGHEDRDHEDRDHEEEGRIQINERSYSSHPGDCITVLLLPPTTTSVNIRNDSRKTVEVFNGPVCDNGAPIATVEPHSSSFGVVPTLGVASFRVVREDRDND